MTPDPDARYDVVAHPAAQRELDAIPDEPRERLRELIHELAAHREPAQAVTQAKPLEQWDGLIRLRAGRYRCLLAVDRPEVKLLTVDHRDRAYEADRIQVADRRRFE